MGFSYSPLLTLINEIQLWKVYLGHLVKVRAALNTRNLHTAF